MEPGENLAIGLDVALEHGHRVYVYKTEKRELSKLEH